jgi:hypothetical protein
MKLDTAAVLKNLDGSELEEAGAKFTVKAACVRALVTPLEGDHVLAPEEAFKRLEFARRLHGGGEIELQPEEATLLRVRSAKLFNVIVAGQIYELTKG